MLLGVPIAESIGLNGEKISVMALCTLESPCKIPGLLPTALIFLYYSVGRVPLFFKTFFKKFCKTFVDKLFIKRPQLITIEKKTLFLSLPFLTGFSLQTRSKLRKSLKGLLNYCKLQIVFKSQRKSQVFSVSKIAHLLI